MKDKVKENERDKKIVEEKDREQDKERETREKWKGKVEERN